MVGGCREEGGGRHRGGSVSTGQDGAVGYVDEAGVAGGRGREHDGRIGRVGRVGRVEGGRDDLVQVRQTPQS